MGVAPPVNAPAPGVQDANAAAAGFPGAQGVGGLCGIKLPTFVFKFPAIPALPSFPPALPFPTLSLGLNCSTDNPINVTAGVRWGGGRVGTYDPDPDLQLDAAT